ncbi:MAG TPA: hypothetical protein VKU36_01055 [Candidatus Babeliales bacterium]|nr:hypothetical protein [Candidatus Babeliales bacterium]
MKKYFLFLLSFIAIYSHTMEIKIINLSRFPIEVLNHIAYYLPFDDIETEEEFINRTKALTIKEVPQKYLEYLPDGYKHSFQQYLCTARCPNNKIIALLQRLEGNSLRTGGPKQATLMVIDKRNNQTIHHLEFETVKNHSVSKLAISTDGNLIGAIHEEWDYSLQNSLQDNGKDIFLEGDTYTKNVLTITDIINKKTETHDLTRDFWCDDNHPTIAFNKQATHLIMHGYDSNDDNTICLVGPRVPHHKMYPLSIGTPELEAIPQKTFAKYCAQQMICKDWNKQLTLTQ